MWPPIYRLYVPASLAAWLCNSALANEMSAEVMCAPFCIPLNRAVCPLFLFPTYGPECVYRDAG